MSGAECVKSIKTIEWSNFAAKDTDLGTTDGVVAKDSAPGRFFSEAALTEYRRVTGDPSALYHGVRNLTDKPVIIHPRGHRHPLVTELSGMFSRSGDNKGPNADQVDTINALAPAEKHQVAITVAREKAAAKVGAVMARIVNLSDRVGAQLARTVDGRFTLPHSDFRTPHRLDRTNIAEEPRPVPLITAELPPGERTVLLRDYLLQLTKSHTPAAEVSDQFIAELDAKLGHVIHGNERLTYSVYISMKKFPNPFDTRNSHVDLAELQAVRELKALAENTAAISGKLPRIIVMNEAAGTDRFTNSNGKTYLSEFTMLLEAHGLGEIVSIADFNEDLFTKYVSSNGTPETATRVVRSVRDVLYSCYDAVYRNQVDQEQIEEFVRGLPPFKRLGQLVDESALERLVGHIVMNYAVFHTEGEQHVRTSFNKNLDPSILAPRMSDEVWAMILGKKTPTKAQKQAVDEARALFAHGQAERQGFYFKSLMRMRYVLQEVYGQSFIEFATSEQAGVEVDEHTIVPLSITNTRNKLSFPAGRRLHTGIFVDGIEVGGVMPQHGVGVLVNDAIQTIPYEHVTSYPELFKPVEIEVDGIIVEGFEYQKKSGILVDLDGTVKPKDGPIPENVFWTMYHTMSEGMVFGVSTGRGSRSIGTELIEPFKAFLEKYDLAVDEKLFFVSGNNGAYASVGIDNPESMYEKPLDINQVLALEESSTLRRIITALSNDFSLDALNSMQAFDRYCLYLNEAKGRGLAAALTSLNLQDMPLREIAETINADLAASNRPFRVSTSGTASLDVISTGVNKALSLVAYRKYASQIAGSKVPTDDIITIGDSPEENDRQLLSRPSGNSAITQEGPEAVVRYMNTMLGISVK